MGFSTINAKAETVGTAPAFREAFKTRRCLVPADAFYEWQKIDVKTKQPFAIGMKDGSPYPFAGLWERWKDAATKERLETFTVITTDPNEMVEPLHNRMHASCSGRIMTLDSLRKTRSVLLSIYCGVSRRSR
jgi:putative SOS response-associated peptidase YedK